MSRWPDPIVSADWLEARLERADIVVLEVSRFEPDEAAYFGGHIPGAHYAFWKDLCWDDTERRFPDSGEMARRLGALGVGDETTLVLVGDTIQFATYPFWVLTMAGQAHNVFILDGGRDAWELQGRAMATAIPAPAAPQHRSATTEDMSSRVGREEVLAGLGADGPVLLDLRSDEEFAGERVSPISMAIDHGAERAGRIPGATHLYFERFLASDMTFKPRDQLEAELTAAGIGANAELITYCRLSHRASLGWLVLTRLLGRERVRVYDGSWTEWGSMVGMPIEK